MGRTQILGEFVTLLFEEGVINPLALDKAIGLAKKFAPSFPTTEQEGRREEALAELAMKFMKNINANEGTTFSQMLRIVQEAAAIGAESSTSTQGDRNNRSEKDGEL